MSREMCVYVYIYIYMRVCVFIYIYIYIYICVYSHTHTPPSPPPPTYTQDVYRNGWNTRPMEAEPKTTSFARIFTADESGDAKIGGLSAGRRNPTWPPCKLKLKDVATMPTPHQQEAPDVTHWGVNTWRRYLGRTLHVNVFFPLERVILGVTGPLPNHLLHAFMKRREKVVWI